MSRNKYPEETVKRILDVATRLFIEKGYDHTSLQDIISESKMSKGSIYHHFNSKEGIFEAICNHIGEENSVNLARIRDSDKLNGQEKLKAIFKSALFSSNQSLMLTVTPNLLENPKFLAMQIRQIYETVAPLYIEPILNEGIADGSIKTANPHEIAEVIMILNNIWLNPFARISTDGSMLDKNRLTVYNHMLQGVGIELFDDEMIQECLSLYQTKK